MLTTPLQEPNYQGTLSHLTATTGCSTKGIILTTPTQDPTITRDIVSNFFCKGLHNQATHSNHTDTRAHHNKEKHVPSLLQQATLQRVSFHENWYKTPPFQGTEYHLTATIGCSTKWLITTTPIQGPTLPNEIFSPGCYNRLLYHGTHRNNTDTWAHPTKRHFLTSKLQQAAVPRNSF